MTSPGLAAPGATLARSFWIAFFANFVWINLSEVFRYFVFVMPMLRDAFPTLPSVAPMSLAVFLVWGVWDTILVFSATLIPWLFLGAFGRSRTNAILAGSFVWMTVFGILWLGTLNMNLATPDVVLVALPLAWLEMIVAALIARWAMART